MGAVNTPGYGVDNDTWVHSAAANYVTVFTPTMTNELYATLTSFVESFDARKIAALQKSAINYPYNGAFNNNDTQYPQLGTYTTYGGLPLGLWPDYSTNPLQLLKKLQPNCWRQPDQGLGQAHGQGRHLSASARPTTRPRPIRRPTASFRTTTIGPAGTYFADYNGTYADGSPAYGNPHFNSGNALANFFEGQIQDWHQQNFNPIHESVLLEHGFLWPGHVARRLERGAHLRCPRLQAGRMAGLHTASAPPSGIPRSTTRPITPQRIPCPASPGTESPPSVPNSGAGTPPLYFEPRVGFAWDVFKDGKTVVRGGVGIYRFHDSVVDVTSEFAEAENVRYTDLQGFGDNTLEGVNTLHLNPNTYGNTGPGSTETYISPATIYGLDPTDNKEPVTNNYSLSIAQQMPGNWTLQASYVGNNSNSLMDNGTTQTVVLDNVNAIPVGTLFTATAAAAINAAAGYNACNPTGCTPVQAGSLDNIYNYPGDKAVQKARPYPNYSQILVPQHNTYANYNGLQIEAIKHVGPLNFNANYTFSKALGILGSSADFNWTAGIDPFHLAEQLRSDELRSFPGAQPELLLPGGQGSGSSIWCVLSSTTGSSRASPISRAARTCRRASAPRLATMRRAPSDRAPTPMPSSRRRSSARPTSTCSPCSRAIRSRISGAHQYLNPACFSLAGDWNQWPVHRAVCSWPGVLQLRPYPGDESSPVGEGRNLRFA